MNTPLTTLHSRIGSSRCRAALLAAVTSTALLLSACGSSGSRNDGIATAGSSAAPTAPAAQSSSAPTSTVAGNADDALLAFAKCMRDNGVDMPDPKPGDPVNIATDGSEKSQQAMTTCQPILQAAGGTSQVNPAMDKEMQQKMLDYTKCMRDHGVDMADPTFSGGQVNQQIGSGGASIDAQNKANEACSKQIADSAPTTQGG